MSYSTLLMDADDTIFDFPLCEYRALKETIESFGLVFTDEICSSFSTINSALWKKFEMNRITRSELRNRRFAELIEKCFQGFDNTEAMALKYIECLAKQAVFIDGACDALKLLSSRYDIYIITNGLKTVQRGRFSRTDITSFIGKLYISDEMGVQKPSKEYFDMVLEDIPEKDKTKILVVGDSLTSDMQGGRNAGLDTCLYDPKGKVTMPNDLCDYHITSLTELMEF